MRPVRAAPSHPCSRPLLVGRLLGARVSLCVCACVVRIECCARARARVCVTSSTRACGLGGSAGECMLGTAGWALLPLGGSPPPSLTTHAHTHTHTRQGRQDGPVDGGSEPLPLSAHQGLLASHPTHPPLPPMPLPDRLGLLFSLPVPSLPPPSLHPSLFAVSCDRLASFSLAFSRSLDHTHTHD